MTDTWWFWVKNRLLSTEYAFSDSDGEHIGEFKRRGALGQKGSGWIVDDADIQLRLDTRDETGPSARKGNRVVSAIDGSQVWAGGEWLALDLTRDGLFNFRATKASVPVLTIRRYERDPFAVIEIDTEVSGSAELCLLACFILTCDHDTANTLGGGFGI